MSLQQLCGPGKGIIGPVFQEVLRGFLFSYFRINSVNGKKIRGGGNAVPRGQCTGRNKIPGRRNTVPCGPCTGGNRIPGSGNTAPRGQCSGGNKQIRVRNPAQAEEELDFRADESPLKIEVMLNTEEMTLIITKDTGKEAKNPIADNIAALVNSLTQHQKGMQVIPNPPKPQAPKRKKPAKKSGPASAVFVFESMADAIRAAANISPVFRDRSVLYRDKKENQYLLCLTQVSEDATVFAECCLMLVEFGKERDADSSTLAYMDEHYEKILPEAAVETLSTL